MWIQMTKKKRSNKLRHQEGMSSWQPHVRSGNKQHHRLVGGRNCVPKLGPVPIVPTPSCISRWIFHQATVNKPVEVLTWLAFEAEGVAQANHLDI